MKPLLILLLISTAASAQTMEKDYYLYLRKQDTVKKKVDTSTIPKSNIPKIKKTTK